MQSSALEPFRLPTGELVFTTPLETCRLPFGQFFLDLFAFEIIRFAFSLFLMLSTLWVLIG